MKHIIWSSNFEIEDFADFLGEWFPDVTDEYEKYIRCCMENQNYLDDERIMLNIPCNNEIIALADLGLWNGRHYGYKIIGKNVKDILYSDCDFNEWYVDEHNVKAKMIHHDGTNYITYRIFKDGLSYWQKDNFLTAIEEGRCNERMIRRYTKSIRPLIAQVYGF